MARESFMQFVVRGGRGEESIYSVYFHSMQLRGVLKLCHAFGGTGWKNFRHNHIKGYISMENL